MYGILSPSYTRHRNILSGTPKDSARHEKQMLQRAQSRSLRTRRALAGKILTCMPAGDSKNEPHQEKAFFLLSVWEDNHMETHISSQRRQDSITQCDAALAPLRRLSARTAKERQQRNNNQNGVFFFS